MTWSIQIFFLSMIIMGYHHKWKQKNAWKTHRYQTHIHTTLLNGPEEEISKEAMKYCKTDENETIKL